MFDFGSKKRHGKVMDLVLDDLLTGQLSLKMKPLLVQHKGDDLKCRVAEADGYCPYWQLLDDSCDLQRESESWALEIVKNTQTMIQIVILPPL